jgi:hypothetical protein
MTSFGVEWDSTALLYLGQSGQLPAGVIEKTPAVTGEGWTLSLEGTNPAKKRTGDENTERSPVDCMYSIEAQLGVFKSKNDQEFNIDGYMKACQSFKIYWENMMSSRHVTINGDRYPLLTYIPVPYGTKSTPNRKFYMDCARSSEGVLQGTNLGDWAYRDSLKSVKGKPQLTVGIRLKYVTSLFKGIVSLFNTCKKDDSGCYSVPVRGSMYILDKMYSISEGYAKALVFNTPNLDSMILLTTYFLVVLLGISSEGDFKGYIKSRYSIKLRSNLRVIYDDVLTIDEKRVYEDWATGISEDDIVGFNDPNGIVIEWYTGFFVKPLVGYTIEAMPGVDLKVPSLGIYAADTVKLSKYVVLTKVLVDKGYSEKPPSLRIVEGVDGSPTIVYKNADDIMRFDYMEWGTTGDIVYLELRGLMSLFSLARGVSTGVYKDYSKHQGGTSEEALCSFIKYVVSNVLNPSLKLSVGF